MIDSDDYPIVFISKNSSYFTNIDTTILNASIVKGSDACVIVSNGAITDTLKPTIMERYPYHGYRGTKFKGEVNKSYDLKFYTKIRNITQQQQYLSCTCDSVWFNLLEMIQWVFRL